MGDRMPATAMRRNATMPSNSTMPTNSTSTIGKLYDNPKAPVNVDIMGQTVSIQEGRARTSSGRTIQGAKAKFMNYFLYAMAGGERIDSKNLESCSSVCSEWKQKCCATVTMGSRTQKSFMYHCINNAVATQDIKMTIDSVDFSLKCDNTWSGAMQIGATTLTAAGLLMTTLY